MKICILKESLALGGTERSAANTSRVLAVQHDVIIAVYDGSSNRYAYGGRLLDFHLPATTRKLTRIVRNVERLIALKKMLKREKVTLLYQFISINSLLSYATYKRCIKILSARDYSVSLQFADKFYRRLRRADAMICNAEMTRAAFLRAYPSMEPKVFTVYNIIDTSDIVRQARSEVPDEGFLCFKARHARLVVSAGRFCYEKGYEHLIEAFVQARTTCPGLGLVLIGDGAYKDRYLERIGLHGIEGDVYFTGFQDNPYQYMVACDAFVLSSISEGFPNVLAEAMALSLPVISTNCFSGPAEILMEKADYEIASDTFAATDYGILTPRFGEATMQTVTEQLGKAISFMLGDEERMRIYGWKAAMRALFFSPERAAAQLDDIFSELLKRRQRM